MGKLSSLIFLLVVFGVSLVCFKNKKHSIYGLLIIIFVSAIRWDIGNDFYNYYYMAKNLASRFNHETFFEIGGDFDRAEITFQAITYLFRRIQTPVIGIVVTYSIITISIFYITLKKNECIFWGFYALIFSGLLFLTWDQMRQGAAVAVFIWSIKYINSGNFFKYFMSCCIAVLFHNSAIILFPFFFIRYLRLNTIVVVVILTILYAGFVSKFWIKFFFDIFIITDRYADYVINKMELQEFSSGLGLLARLLIYISIYFITKRKHPVESNIMLVGICIYLFSCANEMIERLSTYGTAAIILCLPYMMKEYKTRFSKLIKYPIISLMFILGTYNAYKGTSGCIPYDTIFSQNFENTKFRVREYWL